MRPRGNEDMRSAELVRHLVAGTAEVLLRRVKQEIADLRGVEARVLLDLRAEARLLGLLLEERAPVRMKPLVDAALDRLELGIEVPEPSAHPIDGPLDPQALGLGVGVAVRLLAAAFVSVIHAP